MKANNNELNWMSLATGLTARQIATANDCRSVKEFMRKIAHQRKLIELENERREQQEKRG